MSTLTNTVFDRNKAAGSTFTLLSEPSKLWMKRPVAFLSTTESFGGLERLSLRLAKQLKQAGVDIRYICRPFSPLSKSCRSLGLTQTPLFVRNSADMRAAIQLAEYLKQNNVGILHAHSRRDFVTAVIAVKLASRRMRLRTRLVLHVHQVRRLGDGGLLSDLFFNWGADRVLAVSGAVKRKIINGSLLKRSLVDVLVNGVSEELYQTPGSPQAYEWRKEKRRQWGLNNSVPVIGVVGRLNQKGQSFILDNVPSILEICPDARFVFVGPLDNSHGIEKLIGRIADRTLSDRVILVGEAENMPAIYASIDLLVHLPVDEAFGLAIAEAMASYLPVIASNIGGCLEVIRHNETGLLIEPRNKAQLVDGINRLLGGSSGNFRSKIGMAARQSIERHFTFEQQIERLTSIYDQLSRSDR